MRTINYIITVSPRETKSYQNFTVIYKCMFIDIVGLKLKF